MKHWATPFIGQPYAAAGQCWGLVQTVVRLRLGVDMPDVLDQADPVAAIKRAAGTLGWHRTDGLPREDDIVLMQQPAHPRHVGFMVLANGHLGVLHANGRLTAHGPVGSVMYESLADLKARGCRAFEFWRHSQ